MIRRLKNSTYLEEDWRDEIESKDMSKLGILNINIDGNTMKAGSFFDISGIMFKSDTDTVTTGTQKFLYASNNEGLTPIIYRSDTVPVWDPVKLGYYSGADRAIYNFVYNIPMKNKGDVSTTAEGDSLAKIGILSLESYKPSDWSSSITYQVGDRVYYVGKIYICILIATNRVPSSNPAYWTEVIDVLTLIKSGSFWELNGVVYKTLEDIEFTGAGNFLYVDDQTLLTGLATRSDTVPVWNELKKGFYNGTSRAIYDFYYDKKLENENDLTVSTVPNFSSYKTITQKLLRKDYSRYLEKSSSLPEIIEHCVSIPVGWRNASWDGYLRVFKDKLIMKVQARQEVGSPFRDYLVFIGRNDLSNNCLYEKNFIEISSPLSLRNFNKSADLSAVYHYEHGIFSPCDGNSIADINLNFTQSASDKVPLQIVYKTVAEFPGSEQNKFSCAETLYGINYCFAFPGSGLSSISSKKILKAFRGGSFYSLISIPGDMTEKYWNCCTSDSVNNKIWAFPGTKTSGILSIDGSNVVENSNYGADTNLFPTQGFARSFMLPNNKICAVGGNKVLLFDTESLSTELFTHPSSTHPSSTVLFSDALLGPDGNVYILTSTSFIRFNMESFEFETFGLFLDSTDLLSTSSATYFEGSIMTVIRSDQSFINFQELKFDKPAIPGILRRNSDWSNL